MRILDQLEINKRAKEIVAKYPMFDKWIEDRYMIQDLEFWDIAKIKSMVNYYRYK